MRSRAPTVRPESAPQPRQSVTGHQDLDDLRRQAFPDLTISLEGQAAEQAKTMASLRRGLALGLFGIFLLLSFQFRSYVEPLIVMLAIPMAAIGVVWGHLAMGLELSMPSMLGFASLAGIVVNDSILLVTFVKLHAKDSRDVIQAA